MTEAEIEKGEYLFALETNQHVLQYDQAKGYYLQAKEKNPNDSEVLNALGVLLYFKGDLDEAINLLLDAASGKKEQDNQLAKNERRKIQSNHDNNSLIFSIEEVLREFIHKIFIWKECRLA